MFYAYILQSQANGVYYIGQTRTLDARIHKHNFGQTKSYTQLGRPWILVHSEEYQTRAEALKRENYLKRVKNKRFLEKIIKQGP
ncbi:MAG: hypothetical protein A3H50_00410 [Candidatus Levybacteria bacterium RIFCSPLOWO2_02_FULL_37_10]|nr:MAG: hypothetical protein A2860_02020 [Candidatus Levybacteria bacterium RIFCSPHIGHO2_01_FULL_37_33]OGH17532.1 MAG: hypothetical protein A3C97_01440 [Candidatus Levybacteria bacterium RIFCSPHIGHO2_02_FULL_37_11]OGH29945.1 MAG: hypothetical protein A3F30_01415 [Candidatus Levybacteria bacterium RIFCSPHIGHO2_12_FULL_37_12]OGH32643.1 MAG: hypothetical protein A2953_01280 [Candidatus Levybacteria bacterium RIFCSPLOWO2_01_FULL_36_54]OGH46109.1 MAG: hypothetical protein A3H50_00410 [Candidatus Lev